MNLHEWLDHPDTQMTGKRLSELLGCSKTAVSLWRKHGVPMSYMPRIEEISGGAVSTADMLAHALQRRMDRRADDAAALATAAPAEAA